jgi:glucan phosphoethanolaminetransferase (alkaline phosphatase superfamily)
MSTPDTHHRTTMIVRIVSALALLAAGGIHLFLVLTGTGGVLGVAFVLNFIAGLVLGVGMLVVPRRFLLLVTVLGLLYLVASLGALFIALTVGLFGVQPGWDYPLVRETVIVESIGVVVLGVATVIVFGDRRAQLTRR